MRSLVQQHAKEGKEEGKEEGEAKAEEAPATEATAQCELLLTHSEHSDFVRCVSFDHSTLATTGDDGKVCVLHF